MATVTLQGWKSRRADEMQMCSQVQGKRWNACEAEDPELNQLRKQTIAHTLGFPWLYRKGG